MTGYFDRENILGTHGNGNIGREEMRKLFELMSIERDGFRYLVPWQLFRNGDMRLIASKIMHALKFS